MLNQTTALFSETAKTTQKQQIDHMLTKVMQVLIILKF